jgi:hypothetical protein
MYTCMYVYKSQIALLYKQYMYTNGSTLSICLHSYVTQVLVTLSRKHTLSRHSGQCRV